jgi:perosamine synthetase
MKYYREHLEVLTGVSMNPEPAGIVNGAWMPTAVFDVDSKVTREILQTAFERENVDARVFFHPLSSLSSFEGRSKNRWAEELPTRAINLPSYHDILVTDQQRVVRIVLDAVGSLV